MKKFTQIIGATLAVSSVVFAGNALAARNNNAPLTSPGSTMQSPNRYVQPAPPAERRYYIQPMPRFVPAPPKRYPSCTGAGSLSTSCR